MATIGTRAHAREAIRIAGLPYSEYESVKDTWVFLSGGSIRSVVLHKPSKVVYKIDQGTYSDYDNAAELKNARALRRMTWQHVIIPKTSGFKIGGELVIAMEYFDLPNGHKFSRGRFSHARDELLKRGKFADMHGYNFLIDEKNAKIVPIDMGSERYRRYAEADERVLGY